ncbi:uncharacterized protein LOC124452898 [Xenia sp. Carnegie-2017]|uniref:uncharacterized protein LOC124452898 n=1 Tax=Xenia sp. Carnegie-2017 TaxID=2897299 RepID=UPI001F0452A6|nr:uncharacterized protein LOC124452898 [Xenia sp. Carnegie-2017]
MEMYNTDFSISFASQPLKTLHEMSVTERIGCIKEKYLEEQVKIFYDTLQNEILREPLNKDFKERSVVVPIKTEHKRSLANGGLVKLIIDWLKDNEHLHGIRDPQNFAVAPKSQRIFSSPKMKRKVQATSSQEQDKCRENTSTDEEGLNSSSKSEKNESKIDEERDMTKEKAIVHTNANNETSEIHPFEEESDNKLGQIENLDSSSPLLPVPEGNVHGSLKERNDPSVVIRIPEEDAKVTTSGEMDNDVCSKMDKENVSMNDINHSFVGKHSEDEKFLNHDKTVEAQ